MTSHVHVEFSRAALSQNHKSWQADKWGCLYLGLTVCWERTEVARIMERLKLVI